MDVSSELIHSLLPVFLVTSLHTTTLMVGLIEGIGAATAMVVKVFSGVLSDYWRRRKPLAVFGYLLSAASKAVFALATSAGMVLAARVIDRTGKGIRGAPRDSLLADIAPREQRGAAFGLRQALDTTGAFVGPLLAVALMLLLANDFRGVFQVAVVPGFLAVALLWFGVREPERLAHAPVHSPIARAAVRHLGRRYWGVTAVGAAVNLARFSEAFLVLRAQGGGLPLASIPMVLVGMNAVYALAAYPAGKLSDRLNPVGLLALGIVLLLVADLILSWSDRAPWLWAGIGLWGLHLGMSEGLLARMVADVAPQPLRGTAFGIFNLVSGAALFAGSALMGLLWDHFGARPAFLAGALLSALALVATLARVRTHGHPSLSRET